MRLYVDSNVCIKAMEGTGAVYSFCGLVLRPRSHVRLYCSELALSEVLVGPFKKRNESIDGPVASGFVRLLSADGPLTVVPIDRDVLISAARARAEVPSIKLPDAIHLATATLSNCTHFVTGDQRLLAAARHAFIPVDIDNALSRRDMEQELS